MTTSRMFYSPSMGGFYDAEINGAGIPSDALPLTMDQYLALQASQKPIQPGPDGFPVAVDSPPDQPIVPSSVSPAQARLALLAAGLLDDVEAAVAAGPRAMQIAWQNASIIERDSPTVAALAGALGLTDAQLDDLFTAAAGIFV